MIKHLKYALMAFFLIVGSKLLQVAFIHQEPKKKKVSQKKELVKEKQQNPKVGEGIQQQPDKNSEKETTSKTDTAIEEKKQEESYATESTYPTLDDLKKNYLSIKNASLQEGRSREDVVIRYYKHEKDADKVYALKTLRYYLHEKPATETQGLGSNVIYYGDQVKQEDIQIVAYTLLENGIPLKSIERSKYDWKSNAIEIGTDPLLIGKPNISKDKIRDFSL